MRLDKFLKVSRIIKRRTVANEVCDHGCVTINGRVAKAGAEVKAGDNLTVRTGNRVLTVEVIQTPEVVKAQDAELMYTILESKNVTKE
ncbi:MAG: RNA-binding S4 domain-containing protein [Peptococcaceae bacterium]|nr:RNA-binding S4 domain-containing protein [Peptococcaceae bacterium]